MALRIRTATLAIPMALAALSLALAGCGGDSEPATGTAPEPAPPAAAPPETGGGAGAGGISEAARAQAQQIFQTRCFTCHGMEGRGDGPASAGLSPQPRNFHDVDWQASVTDEHIANIIQYGGAAVGKSPTMPGNPDLISKPEVVAALVEHIRSFGSQ